MRPRTWLGIVLIWLAGLPAGAQTFLVHTNLDHAEPRVGHRTATAPAKVRVWFDKDVLHCLLRVENAEGRLITRGTARVSPANSHLLELELPQHLPAGDYQVYYEVEDTDGHTTEGDYQFSVGPGGE